MTVHYLHKLVGCTGLPTKDATLTTTVELLSSIHSYLNKLCALQQLPDCIDACNIIYKRLQGSYKK